MAGGLRRSSSTSFVTRSCWLSKSRRESDHLFLFLDVLSAMARILRIQRGSSGLDDLGFSITLINSGDIYRHHDPFAQYAQRHF